MEVGEGVTRATVGDHVVITNVPECGKCKQCLSPFSNICQQSGFANQITFNPFHLDRELFKPIYKTSAGESI